MSCRRIYRSPYGAEVLPDGSVRFRLWAPAQQGVSIKLTSNGRQLPMHALERGWHELTTSEAAPGSRYYFVLEDDLAVPDPASRFQPEDIGGPSEVIDPTAYVWHDEEWQGRPWEQAVLYELHVGTFSPSGTFQGVIDRLAHLAALGVTALSIMPIGDFPGRFNWGYDGALLFAPDSSYGRPEDFKALVDAAHRSNLMVLLDVVYNHFGPLGNYLHSYAPQFFSEEHATPWGPAINFDGPRNEPVRDFMIHNALYWLTEFHLDGLRLDAVHAMVDRGKKHFVTELAERVRTSSGSRHIHLVIENEANQAVLLQRDTKPALVTAQWNDDVHHVLHTAATNEAIDYYQDYHGDTHKLAVALAEGFAFQGDVSQFLKRQRGEPSGYLPPTAFIAFIQNHDQVGNRLSGERIGHLAPSRALRAITALYLLLPQIPMLFMGEEWHSARPFPYFCDYHGDLAESIRSSRANEYQHFLTPDGNKAPPFLDPTAMATFAAAKLDWAEINATEHASVLAWYQQLLQCRHREIVPLLTQITSKGVFEIISNQAVLIRWQAGTVSLLLMANLSDQDVEFPSVEGRCIWQEGSFAHHRAGPWTVRYLLAP